MLDHNKSFLTVGYDKSNYLPMTRRIMRLFNPIVDQKVLEDFFSVYLVSRFDRCCWGIDSLERDDWGEYYSSLCETYNCV